MKIGKVSWAAQAHEFPLICQCVKLVEYSSCSWSTVGGGVEISTLLSAALLALQNFYSILLLMPNHILDNNKIHFYQN